MSKKKIYQALLDGVANGLVDDALFDFVRNECPKATSKKIVRASLLALSDPDLRDANTLRVIYALAIRHRLDPVVPGDSEPDDDDDDAAVDDAKADKRAGKKARKTEGKKSKHKHDRHAIDAAAGAEGKDDDAQIG